VPEAARPRGGRAFSRLSRGFRRPINVVFRVYGDWKPLFDDQSAAAKYGRNMRRFIPGAWFPSGFTDEGS